MLGLKLNHITKRGSCALFFRPSLTRPKIELSPDDADDDDDDIDDYADDAGAGAGAGAAVAADNDNDNDDDEEEDGTENEGDRDKEDEEGEKDDLSNWDWSICWAKRTEIHSNRKTCTKATHLEIKTRKVPKRRRMSSIKSQ